MSITNLHIFSKNTDAFASQRGYNYQTLKTLEAWVNNLSKNIEEDIYCEYEEDIFQKNILKGSVKFRQIKLYSSNFSFKSEEITKCISHFFMLHIKSEYTSFDKEFIFETNSEVARKHLNNEADLLSEWFENQENLSAEQIKKYSEKVKEIVSEYIQQQEKKITDDNNEELVKEAIKIFKGLEDSFWIEFAKLIKWKFLGVNSDDEFSNTKSRIEELLCQLPYDIGNNNIQQVFGVLLEKVFTKASQEKSENRRLTTNELILLILNIGNEEDKWYSQKFEYYNNIEKIEEFRIGEFFEVLDLVNYCRRKKYLINHKEKWNSLLEFYTKNEEIDPIYRRKSIYELIFLNNESHELNYDDLKNIELPKGNLIGFENEIKFYFQDFDNFKEVEELEEAQTILNLLFPSVLRKKVEISKSEFKKWNLLLAETIDKRLLNPKNVSEKCHLLEEKGNYLLMMNLIKNNNKFVFIEYFEQILTIVDDAPLYKVSQFGDRINKYIKMFINLDSTDENKMIMTLETFSEKLYPFLEKREGKIKLARQQVERGVSYLRTNNSSGLLKALEYFHKAKDNYQQEDTIEGFTLALLNISQLYNSIGMHFAGKYYALSAFRMSVNKELIKSTEKSLAQMFYADFKQGSWFNAINVFNMYMNLRDQSNIEISNYEEEGRITQRLSLMLYCMKRTSFQYNYFIDDYVNYLDYFGTDIVKPIFKIFDDELNSEDKFLKLLEGDLDDFPLNDVGKHRTISFYALGSLWKIMFENNYQITSVAEEYIATIQIILTEISLSGYDFHLLKSTIEIELLLSDTKKPPIQISENSVIKWQVNICFFDNSDTFKINEHTVFNTVSFHLILNTISLLKQEEFKDLFFKLIKERSLDSKQISVNLYQRIHRDIYTKKDFAFTKRDIFQKEDIVLNLPSENNVMKWNDSLSEKYSQTFSITAIENRFKNAHNAIYLTLEHLKKNPDFSVFINDLRRKGWKDWQIILSIYNFIINYKIKKFENTKFINDSEAPAFYSKMFIKYKNLDEKNCYIHFPLEAFQSKEFLVQFNITFSSIIQTYGLENKSITPNFKAIKEFLDVRFNFANDDYSDNNPLKDVLFE